MWARGSGHDGSVVPHILDDAALEAAAVTWSHPEDSFSGAEVTSAAEREATRHHCIYRCIRWWGMICTSAEYIVPATLDLRMPLVSWH